MNTYKITIKDKGEKTVKGNNPVDAFHSIFSDLELVTAKDRRCSNVCIELIGGQRKSVNYYMAIKKAVNERTSKYAEVRSDYYDDEECMQYIDAWRTDSDDEEGMVIAKVNLETGKVIYLDNDARKDAYAQEVINEVIQEYC